MTADPGTGWERLAEALAGDLTRLGDGDTVALSVGPRYVQLLQLPTKLVAETVANDVLPPAERLSTEDLRRIAALGWPSPGDPRDNWRVELGWPVHSRDSRRLADLLVRTLAEVHLAPSPEALEYTAFNTLTGEPVTVPALAGLRRSD